MLTTPKLAPANGETRADIRAVRRCTVLLRIACVRCHLASLWTDEPRYFLATVCCDPRRCEAELLDEEFRGVSLPRPLEPHAPRAQTRAEL